MNEGKEVSAELIDKSLESSRLMLRAAAESPAAVLARATEAAKTLGTVLKQKADPVKFNGQQYLEFEDWQTVGNFYHVCAKVVTTTFVTYGEVKGFECHAEAINSQTGQVMSAADAMCLNDEEKWSSRAKYEWKNGTRTKVGEVPVPLFQLRSMAQTRACAKALRNVLAWVVVLAGYKATPAEEMDGVLPDNKAAAPAKSQPTADSAAPANPAPAGTDNAAATKRIFQGLITAFKEPTQGKSGKMGPSSATIEGERVDTFDKDIAASLQESFINKERVKVLCDIQHNGRFTNYTVTGFDLENA